MQVRLLGPVEVLGEDDQPIALASGRERVLMAALALGANRSVSTNRLVDALWGEDAPATAANALQVHVSKLRKKLPLGALELSGGGYLLHVEEHGVDVVRFERLIADATDDPREAAATLRQALELWRGPALADVASDTLAGQRVRLDELRLVVLERRIDADLELGRHLELIPELEALVHAEPYREGFRRQLMVALYRSGRQSDALAVYREARDLLAVELGVDPGPELQALELAILNQAPELEAQARIARPAKPAPPSGTVTFLMTDIEGSTRLWEEYPEEMAVALRRHDDLLRQCIEDNAGYVVKTVGDAFHAAFPTGAQAVAAATNAQRLLGDEEWPAPVTVRVRVAIHTGHGEERGGDYFGPAVNRVARLVAVAHGGQVLISGTTAQILEDGPREAVTLRDLGHHRLKDLSRPEHVYQLLGPGLVAEFPPLRSVDNPQLTNNLPAQVTSFVGRTAEIAAVRGLLKKTRLVTLAGAGGSGKTRLAVHVAAETLDAFEDGVWLVELSSLRDPKRVAPEVASVLGIREEGATPITETLTCALSGRHLLVVMDNCEHLLDECATLAGKLLQRCPRLFILATSREALSMPGEQVYQVPAMSLPSESGRLTLEGAGTSDAFQLFCERTLAHQPAFEPDDENASIIAALCRQLDGMPLAIEIATARLSSLSLLDLNDRLYDRLQDFSTRTRAIDPRHQTLQALIDWSYDLLDEREQTVFQRLSIFAGGWTLDAAERVCAGSDLPSSQIAELLGSLVDKSLIQADVVGNSLRYKFLETVRHYALEKHSQRTPEERDSVRTAHAQVFYDLATTAAVEMISSDQAAWFARLNTEHDNLRTALTNLLSSPAGVEQALQMGIYLRDFWSHGGHYREGLRVLEDAIARYASRDGDSRLYAAGLLSAARLYFVLGEGDVCRSRSELGLSIARHVGDAVLAADALEELASLEYNRKPDLSDALAMVEEALELVKDSEDPVTVAEALKHRGIVRANMRRAGARDDYMRALELYRAAGNRLGAAQVLNGLAILELKQNKPSASIQHVEEAEDLIASMEEGGMPPDPLLDLLTVRGLAELLNEHSEQARLSFSRLVERANHYGIRPMISYGFIGLGFCATLRGQYEAAAVFHGAGNRINDDFGIVGDSDLRELQQLEFATLRDALGPAFDSAYDDGYKLMLSDAVALAIT
jgi:predicted ATPase/class 3 adenylate cyclase